MTLGLRIALLFGLKFSNRLAQWLLRRLGMPFFDGDLCKAGGAALTR